MVAAAYEEIAETRPRIRRDVLFTQTPDGVLFHNARGGFHLNAKSAYRFSTIIVPYLTGEHRVADICAGLGEQQRAMVTGLVKTLYERDFARDVPAPDKDAEPAVTPEVARRFAEQIAYVDHYTDGAEERFGRFRDTRVAVVGDDLVARWCVLSLVRNGCAAVGVLPGVDAAENRFAEVLDEARALTDEGCPVRVDLLPGEPGTDRDLDWAGLQEYDTVVVTGGAAAPRRVHRLMTAGVPRGKVLLPAWTFGRRAVVGPLTAPGTPGCWSCAALRLGANATGGEAADLWSGIALPGGVPAPGHEPGRPLSAMLGNLLGYEIFRIATRALPPETEGRLLVQDMESLDVVAEPLLPHPNCPYCSGEPDTAQVAALRDSIAAGLAVPPVSTVETAREADALVEELNERTVLVRPHAGVFAEIDDESLPQTPLKVSTLRLALGHSGRRRIAAFDVHHVAGARIRALFTAAEVYAEHAVPLRGVLRGSAAEAADAVRAEPTLLSTASGAGHGAPPGAWTPATSLLTKETVLVPAAAVHTFGADNRDRTYVPTRAGTGAGGSAAEAVGRGLLSALSYDALLRAVRGTGRPAPVPLDGFADDPELTFLIRTADTLGTAVDLLDLGESEHSSAHVLLARATDPHTGEPIWAVGADTAWRTAASAAIRDLLGQAQLRRELDDGDRVDTGDPLLGDLDPRTLNVTDDPDSVTGADASTSFATVLERLRAAGRDALAVPLTSADLLAGGISTARVVLVDGAGHAD